MESNKNIGLYALIIVPILVFIVIFGFLISISGNSNTSDYNFVYQIADYSRVPEVIDGKIIDIKAECDEQNSLIKNKKEELKNKTDLLLANQANEVEYTKIFRESDDLGLELNALENDLDYSCKTDYNNTKYFTHNTKDNTSRQVSLEELNKLDLINTRLSPDGYEFLEYYYPDQTFNFTNNKSKYNVLLKNKSAKEQNLIASNNGYDVQFIAWYKN